MGLVCFGERSPERAEARAADIGALLRAELAQAMGDRLVRGGVGAEAGEERLGARAGKGLVEDLAGRRPVGVVRDSHPVCWREAGDKWGGRAYVAGVVCARRAVWWIRRWRAKCRLGSIQHTAMIDLEAAR